MGVTFTRSGATTGGKAGLGCLVLFALPFASIGVFMAFKAVDTFAKGNAREAVFALVFAIMFGGAGFGLMVAGWIGFKLQKKNDALKVLHPDKPWLWRTDWAAGRIASSNKGAMIGLWIFAVAWNLISDSIAFAVLGEHKKFDGPLFLVFLFPLIGVGALTMAIHATLRWKKYGQSWLRLLNNPAAIGGQLSGAIETSVKVRPEDGFKLKLRSIRHDTSGDNNTEHTLWEDEKIMVKDLLDDRNRTGIPVFFQIPADCLPCDDSNPKDKILWRLEVKAKTPGPDYQALFDVPVFKTADSAAAAQPVTDPTVAFQQPASKPAYSRNQVRTLPDGSTEFYFPPARNGAPILFLVVFMATWNMFLWFMITHRTPIPLVVVFGLVDVVLFLFFLGAICKSIRVTIDADGLVSRQKWLLFTITRRLALAEIREIKMLIGMTVGSTSYYNIQAVKTDGRTVTLASAIREKQETDWFAGEMRRLLKLDKAGAASTIPS